MSTALYRRYRPDSFAEMIGQEQVTEPLMQALRTGRVNHAYLFSGPRGCGKTTSARILARCLNCENGPTPEPCGTCDSCIALARGGSGTVDVIEIDAASHGGVDDARDLRERAAFGPAQSRYKIYIIDEAHMVTPQGFNALLKIVEEPPEHVKFIFATTEPEKVIGTIRSRTHHYPFRLVPPARLGDYLQQLCDAESVPVEPGVLSFVTRAGGGSVRDSLSVLDQLIAGSGAEGLTYAGAASLLGFTDAELLDATVDAFAVGDGAAVFRQIDRVVESGHDPRRFVEDLLERLRDLIVVAAVADGAAQVLRTVPEDQLERMRQQAAAFGPGALSRAADVVNAGLTEMTGATSPRLQLEIMCARVLLPASSGEQGYAARLDRIERRMEMGSSAPAAAPVQRESKPRVEAPAETPAPVEAPAPVATVPVAAAQDDAAQDDAAQGDAVQAAPPAETPAADAAPAPTHDTAPAGHASVGGANTDMVRRAWPDVLTEVARHKKVTWSLLSQHAHVMDYDGNRILLGTSSQGIYLAFTGGPHPDIVRAAFNTVLGIDVRVEAQVDQNAPAPAQTAPRTAPTPAPEANAAPQPTSEQPPQSAPERPATEQQATPKQQAPSSRGRLAAAAAETGQSWSNSIATAPDWATAAAAEWGPPPGTEAATKPAAKPAQSAPTPVEEVGSIDDEDVDDLSAVGVPVIKAVLGATVIDEQVD